MTRRERTQARAEKLRWLLDRTHRPAPKRQKQSREDYLTEWYFANLGKPKP